MAYARINGVRYHYQVEGKGAPLAMLHGFTGCQANWDPHIDQLADSFQTIRFDLLGHGRTDSPKEVTRYSMEKSAEDIMNLLRRLVDDPVNLLGYSMGGRLALFIALSYPGLVNRVIMESASPGLRDESDRRQRVRRDEQLALSIERGGIEDFVGRWERLALFAGQSSLPPPKRAELRRQRLLNDTTGLANSLRSMGTGAQPSLWSRLEELKMPVLLMAGELDHKFVDLAWEMEQLAHNACVKIVPGAGHTIHLEQPKLFDELIKRFLGNQ